MSYLSRALSARIDDMAIPRRLSRRAPDPALPTHRRPGILSDNIGTIRVIKDVVAHPVRKCHVAPDEILDPPRVPQDGPSELSGLIQEADFEAVQLVSRRSGRNLARRNGITAEQEVLSAALNLKRVSHHLIDHPMAPCDVPLGRLTKHGKLSRFENPGELWLNQLANRGLTHSASARDEKEHRTRRVQYPFSLATRTTSAATPGHQGFLARGRTDAGRYPYSPLGGDVFLFITGIFSSPGFCCKVPG